MMEMLGRVANQLSVAGLPEAAQQGMAMIYLDRVVSAQAQMLGFQDGFVALTMIALAPLIPVMYLLRLQMRRKQS